MQVGVSKAQTDVHSCCHHHNLTAGHSHFHHMHWFINFHSTTFWGWGLRFKPQVQVQPLLEPEPVRRFRFWYSAKPDSQTPGLKLGLNQVQKVQEVDCSQSKTW